MEFSFLSLSLPLPLSLIHAAIEVKNNNNNMIRKKRERKKSRADYELINISFVIFFTPILTKECLITIVHLISSRLLFNRNESAKSLITAFICSESILERIYFNRSRMSFHTQNSESDKDFDRKRRKNTHLQWKSFVIERDICADILEKRQREKKKRTFSHRNQNKSIPF